MRRSPGYRTSWTRVALELAALLGAAHAAACGSAMSRTGGRGRDAAAVPAEGGAQTDAPDGDLCAAVAADRARFQSRTAEGSEPHLVAFVPFELLDSLVARQVQSLDPFPLDSLEASGLGLTLSGLTARARSVAVRPAPADHVGLRILADVELDGRPILSLSADADVVPTLDAAAHELVVAIRAEDLRRIEPQVGPEGATRLAAELRRLLPGPLAGLVPSEVVRQVANVLVREVVAEGWPSIRDALGSSGGVLTRLSLGLPGVPLDRMSIASSEAPRAGLVVALWTGFPVRGASAAPELAAAEAGSDTLTLFIPDATAAEIGNWAMREGRIPSRLDSRGRPAADGPIEVGLDYRPGPRPLAAHLWQADGRCMRALALARAEVSVEGDRVVLAATDARIEQAEGPLEIRMASFASRLWGGALERSTSMANELRFTVGGEEYEAGLVRVERVEAGFRAVVRLRSAGQPPG